MTATRWLLAASLVLSVACDASTPPPPPADPGPASMRRLTEDQYRASIADIFGADIEVAGPFEPDIRRDGLLNVGATFASVTPSGFEHYESMALAIAGQVLEPARRDAVVPCVPARDDAPDDACAAAFVAQVGQRLFRRTLTADEVSLRTGLARDVTGQSDDFYVGLQFALASMLLAPDFLFRVERLEPDPSGGERVTGASLATRLSYFLWSSTPDEELLAAAQSGALVTTEGLTAQVDRMLASPRLAEGVAAFFADLYQFDAIDHGAIRKDTVLYPAFSQAVIADAKEQTLRVITDHLLEQNGDYRALFTTRRTFVNRSLGVVYRIPVASSDGWEEYEFPDNTLRPGILGHVSLLSVYAHPGRSSATLRGKFIRETLLCQKIPPPPPDVDFSAAEDVDGEFPTARDRLKVHQIDDGCRGCHTLMDPPGLGLENFDAIGAERERENDVVIDASGNLDGDEFDGPAQLGRALRDHAALGPCLSRTMYRYALGRGIDPGEEDYQGYLADRFADSGYRVRGLMRTIALSEGFRKSSGPRPLAEEQ